MNSAISLFTLKAISSKILPPNISLGQVISFLKIPPNQRQVHEVGILKALTSSISFFKNQEESAEFIHYQSCQAMKYEFFTENQVVFNIGDYGRKFYIIISGSVEVLVEEFNTDHLVQVAVLIEGQSFGDIALVTENPRNATVKCLTDCHFAVLNKDDYLRILGKITDKKISLFVEFIKNIPVFKSWSKKSIESIYCFFKPVDYNWKKKVFSVGEEAKHVYIVKSGEFEISKNVTLANKMKVSLKIAVLAEGEIFGDEDVLNGKLRECNCMCYSTTGSLLIISAKDFLLNITNEDSLSILNSKNSAKSLIRSSKESNFQSIFTTSRSKASSSPEKKVYNSLKYRKKCLPVQKMPKDYSRYLELSPTDIENIKEKAMGRRNRRILISMNMPMDLSYRTPSPNLKIKLKPLYTKSSHIESNYFSIQKSVGLHKSFDGYYN